MGAGEGEPSAIIRANLPVGSSEGVMRDGGMRESDTPGVFAFSGVINSRRRLYSSFCPVSAFLLPYSLYRAIAHYREEKSLIRIVSFN